MKIFVFGCVSSAEGNVMKSIDAKCAISILKMHRHAVDFNIAPAMSEMGLGCVKTPTPAALVENSRSDCASGESNHTAHNRLDAT
jgi:hypothetical protein